MKLENQCNFFGLSCPSSCANARFEPYNLVVSAVFVSQESYLERPELDRRFRHDLQDIETIA